MSKPNTITYVLPFNVLPPNHNDWDRMHYRVRMGHKQQWFELMCAVKSEIEWQHELPLKKCGVTWVLHVARRRDWDNAPAMLKPVFDGMKAAGIVMNDSPVCIEWLKCEQTLVGTDPEWCEIRITVAEPIKPTRIGKWVQPVLLTD